MLAQFNVILQNPGRPKKIFFLTHGLFMCIQHHCMYTLGLQVPPQKVFGPSKPTPNTFLEGTTGALGICLEMIFLDIAVGKGSRSRTHGRLISSVDFNSWDAAMTHSHLAGSRGERGSPVIHRILRYTMSIHHYTSVWNALKRGVREDGFSWICPLKTTLQSLKNKPCFVQVCHS